MGPKINVKHEKLEMQDIERFNTMEIKMYNTNRIKISISNILQCFNG